MQSPKPIHAAWPCTQGSCCAFAYACWGSRRLCPWHACPPPFLLAWQGCLHTCSFRVCHTWQGCLHACSFHVCHPLQGCLHARSSRAHPPALTGDGAPQGWLRAFFSQEAVPGLGLTHAWDGCHAQWHCPRHVPHDAFCLLGRPGHAFPVRCFQAASCPSGQTRSCCRCLPAAPPAAAAVAPPVPSSPVSLPSSAPSWLSSPPVQHDEKVFRTAQHGAEQACICYYQGPQKGT